MNWNAGEHNQDHQDAVFLYALQALGSNEISAAEAQIATCADCRHELETIQPVIQSFAGWPTDVLRPLPSLWDRLAKRIADETGQQPFHAISSPAAKDEWEQVVPGVFIKFLAMDHERCRTSMLVRLASGTDYPPHRHAGVEELHLLHGELRIDEKTLYPGDYVRGQAGTVDHKVWSETGCTCILMTSTEDEIL
jgi:ChrR-like protein with cupin domain